MNITNTLLWLALPTLSMIASCSVPPPALQANASELLREQRQREARALAESDVERADSVASEHDASVSTTSYARVARLRWVQGDHAAAKDAYRAALGSHAAAQPLDEATAEVKAEIAVEYARIFFLNGDYPGAGAGYELALRLMPDFVPALIGAARVALANSHWQDAATFAKRAFEISALAEAAWVWGDAACASGDRETCREAYGHLMRIGREQDRWTLAAFLSTINRDANEAVKLAEEALETRNDIYTHDLHAWALYRAGRLQEAKAASERALRFGTRDPMLLFHAGAIQAALGERDGLTRVKSALLMSPRFQLSSAIEATDLLKRNSRHVTP